MQILLIGSGGREHALAWKMTQSPLLTKLFIAPGNAGTRQHGTNVALNPNNHEAVKQFILDHKIDMVVVGPEEPLVNGIYDALLGDPRTASVPVIGPSKAGAALEGSKDFAKAFMQRHQIPTAAYLSVTEKNLREGMAFLETLQAPYVLKADGLAAGKGVLILDSLEEARSELKQMIEGKFGKASATVVIEAYLDGIECSVFVLTDGKNFMVLPEAKDYKRIGEGDTGLNTGGMGAVSPVPFADAVFMKKVTERIVKPTIDGFQKENIVYKGFVFIGLMQVNGEPFVIEYNVRMGDPETEVVMPRIENDLVELFLAVANGSLHTQTLQVSPLACTTVMLVAGGYPGEYAKGDTITGLDQTRGSLVFHAGTLSTPEGIVTQGGRVIAVSSLAPTRHEALALSFENARRIEYRNKYFRSDIGFDL